MRKIFIGYDPREAEAFVVARRSMRRHAYGIPIDAICLDDMRDLGLYTRTHSRRGNQLWDDISDAPMSTEFAVSRFLTPHLARSGWALFADCDVLARSSMHDLFAQADPSKAVMCVQHQYVPNNETKMDGQAQTIYARKNWSSVMLFNCDHPANKRLTVEMVNTLPGRALHAFCWLKDRDIGALEPGWNWLAGVSDPTIEPKLVHFTNGGPWFENCRNVPYADEWLEERREWLEEDARVSGLPSTWQSKFDRSANAAHI